MTSFPANGKTRLNRKLCMIDVWLLLKTIIKSGSPFQNLRQWITSIAPSGDITMTSFSANGLPWLYRKRCMMDVWLLLITIMKSGSPSIIRLDKLPAAPPGEEYTKTSFPVHGKTWLYRKRCMIEVWLLLNTNIKSESPFPNPPQWITFSAP